MIILVAGASHTGKTALAQRLLKRYHYPVLSLDLLKMGLIRSGQTSLTPEDDELLTPYVWSIASEMIKTAIENDQNLIVEGCYIPFDWQESFSPSYLAHINYWYLVMSEPYIRNHASTIRAHANVAKKRLHGEIDFEELVRDNLLALEECERRALPHRLMEDDYNPEEWSVAPFSSEDAREASLLFRATVHTVNTRDYTPEQVNAWAPHDDEFLDIMTEKLASQRGARVRECGILIGFGTLDEHCDIDMLYVHKDRQGQGIARRILAELEAIAAASKQACIRADVSLTARPFFECMGYEVVRKQTVIRRGVELTNYHMKKLLRPVFPVSGDSGSAADDWV